MFGGSRSDSRNGRASPALVKKSFKDHHADAMMRQQTKTSSPSRSSVLAADNSQLSPSSLRRGLECTIGVEKRRQDVNAWFSTNRKTPAEQRLGKPLYLPCNVQGVRPGSVEPSFGTLVEDPTQSVNDLSQWTPREHNGQATAVLTRLYRTTMKRGSKAHTVWDCVWEKPVERSAKIQAEIDRRVVSSGDVASSLSHTPDVSAAPTGGGTVPVGDDREPREYHTEIGEDAQVNDGPMTPMDQVPSIELSSL